MTGSHPEWWDLPLSLDCWGLGMSGDLAPDLSIIDLKVLKFGCKTKPCGSMTFCPSLVLRLGLSRAGQRWELCCVISLFSRSHGCSTLMHSWLPEHKACLRPQRMLSSTPYQAARPGSLVTSLLRQQVSPTWNILQCWGPGVTGNPAAALLVLPAPLSCVLPFLCPSFPFLLCGVA